jgi:alanine dehydrogenase
MRIGIPKEIKDHEYRAGLTPSGAHALTAAGHTVLVQRQAGARIGFSDDAYAAAGATLAASAADVYQAELIVKVKEIQPSEYDLLRENQILFTYLHLAPDPALTQQLLQKKIIGIAYETVTDAHGQLPLLRPMSTIAGRMSVQVGAWGLQMATGGIGTLLPGAPGVPPGKVVILGGGTVGSNAARIALGLGADVTLCDVSPARLSELDVQFGARLKTAYADAHTVAQLALEADLLIGAVLVPGKLAPKVLRRETVRRMRPGSVIVDVAIDQGGCCETSRVTTHSAPYYIDEGVVHYCVGNMPGGVARTATLALTQATLPYVLNLANRGLHAALRADAGFANGVQLYAGHVTHAGIAADLKLPLIPLCSLTGI